MSLLTRACSGRTRVSRPVLKGSTGRVTRRAADAQRYADTRKGMRQLVLALCLCIGTFFTGSCASACHNASCCVPGGPQLTENPFRLDVQIEPSRMSYGQNITVSYTLTNISTEAVASCAAGWDRFELVDAKGVHQGSGVAIFTGWSETNDPFRLPPTTALSWQVKMVLPQAAPGPAQFQGMFQSGAGSWVGVVRSEPIVLEIVE